MIDIVLLTGFLAAAVRVATPLALAALGEMLTERTGVLNLGIEGAMLAGALGAAIGASSGASAGLTLAMIGGMAASGVFAAFAIGRRSDQIITGTAITIGFTGLTGLIAQRAFGNAGTSPAINALAPVRIPGLVDIPLLGPAFFAQSILTYLVYLLIPVLVWFLWRTRAGRRWRACGESTVGARAAGIRVTRVRVMATMLGGALAGLAGASLVLAQVGTFTERMTAGRGFIAIAIVVLGRWHPMGVGLAALLFGAATALQYVMQANGSLVPWQILLALPYILALAALAFAVGRRSGPAELGK